MARYPKPTDGFGAVLREHRCSLGLTLAELAERTDLTGSYLSRIENNVVAAPPFKTMMRIAKALKVDVSVLMAARLKVPSEATRSELEAEIEYLIKALQKSEATASELQAEVERLNEALQKSESNYQWMLARAVKGTSGSPGHDGNRELGAKVAVAEASASSQRLEVQRLRTENERLRSQVSSLTGEPET